MAQARMPRWLRSGAGLLSVSVLGVCILLAGCGSRPSHDRTSSRSAPRVAVDAGVPVHGASDDVAGMAGGPPPWPCTGWAHGTVTAYDRAGAGARVFGTLQSGDPVPVVARNADGWLAFSPGTAQAANVGPFRLRWLPPDAPLHLEGACNDLPVRESPASGVCFQMAMAPTPIRTAPRNSAPLLATLPADGYVAVTGGSPSGWIRVEAGSGSLPGSGAGWIAPEAVNVNGPCDAFVGRGASP